MSPQPTTRRSVLGVLAGLGIGTGAFRRALAARAEEGEITLDTVKQAEWIAGISLTDEQRETAKRSLGVLKRQTEAIQAFPLAYDVVPAFHFEPRATADATRQPPTRRDAVPIESAAPQRPDSDEDLAFLPLTELSALLRTRQLSSVELTQLCLRRLERFDPLLKCVVTLTSELAMQQAERADRELKRGIYRGPLHGVPWGAKDLIAYPGYPTTWGAPQFHEQVLDQTATVAQRLDAAGAVLVGKLSLGALAMGDRWFGGRTRNPWNPTQGSSGSSAGSAAAVCAGLVPFALGSETMGSIVSPSRRCSVTGLRPTFGRVSRHGCMPLTWTMDKIGPIARSVEACALVFDAIHGGDGLDPTALTYPFHWPATNRLRNLRVGVFQSDGEGPIGETLRRIGCQVVPIELPKEVPDWPLTTILHVEAAASFDELTRDGVTEGLNSWPGIFHRGHFTSAVDYVRANRIRTLLIERLEALFQQVDVYIRGDDVVMTNLTGHPCIVIPIEHDVIAKPAKPEPEQKEAADKSPQEKTAKGSASQPTVHRQPTTISFTGRLFDESTLLALAHAFQMEYETHLKRPPLEAALAEMLKQEKASDKADAKES